MGDRTAQARGPHLLLYDGECGLCHWIVRFVLARDREARFHFAALQSDAAARELAPLGGRPADLTTFYVIEDYRGTHPRLRSRGRAALVVAGQVGWPWRAATVFRWFPNAWVDAMYLLVARHRHRILGRADACITPRPEDRDRFLDAGELPRP